MSLLPHGLPPKIATYSYFAAWRHDGAGQVVHELLRCQVRGRARRLETPALAVLDTRVSMRPPGPPSSRPASIRPSRCPAASAGWPWTSSVRSSRWSVDQGFKKQAVEHGAGLGIDVESIERNPQDKGFVPQPKRWRGRQTYGILVLHRRMVRDYEHHPSSFVSRVYWAMTHVVIRRLTGANSPTRRDAQAVSA